MRRRRNARDPSKRTPLHRRLLMNPRARPRKRKRPRTKGKRPRSLRRAPQSRGRRSRKRNMPRGRRNHPPPHRKRVPARRPESLTKARQANLRLPLRRKNIGSLRQRLPPRPESRRRNRKKIRRRLQHRIHQRLLLRASRHSRPSLMRFQFPVRKSPRSPSRNPVSRKIRVLSLLLRRHRGGLTFGHGPEPIPLLLTAICRVQSSRKSAAPQSSGVAGNSSLSITAAPGRVTRPFLITTTGMCGACGTGSLTISSSAMGHRQAMARLRWATGGAGKLTAAMCTAIT